MKIDRQRDHEMMQIMPKEQTHDDDDLHFEADCPTCETHAVFEYRGKQVFPVEVAEKLGYPNEIHLWSCSNCHTTISHVDLGIEL